MSLKYTQALQAIDENRTRKDPGQIPPGVVVPLPAKPKHRDSKKFALPARVLPFMIFFALCGFGIYQHLRPKESHTPFYTLQVASFRNEDRAKEEVRNLKATGYSAFVIQGNRYYGVCAEKFVTEALALKKLPELKKSLYRDAFVRSVQP